MKIDFQETTKDLQTRIDIHSQFGGRNIDAWMLEILNLKPGLSILDVACGAGKQCLAFHEYLKGNARIVGGDVSQDLLNQARAISTERHASIEYIDLNFNERFPIEDNQFDLESCCFAIYYAQDIPFTIKEMHRVLKPGGRLFTTGPMPDNKRLFYDIIREATNKPIPPMPGSSRYGSEILSTITQLFSHVDLQIFENPLTFDAVEPYIAYTRASLSEDRKLWNTFFDDKDTFETMMKKIEETAQRRLDRDGKLVMTKVVGGITATK